MMKTVEYWECGVCHMTTFGEWNCEVKDRTSTEDEDYKPVCKSCEDIVRENFVPDEEI